MTTAFAQDDVLAVPSSELARMHSLITDIKTRMAEERGRLQGELALEERRCETTAARLAVVWRHLRIQLSSVGVDGVAGLSLLNLRLLFRIWSLNHAMPSCAGTRSAAFTAPDALVTVFHAWRAHAAFQSGERLRSSALLGTLTRVHEWMAQRKVLRVWQVRL